MKKFYLILCSIYAFFALVILPQKLQAQDCTTLTATYTSSESRCTATGSIQIKASGGSGNYQYKASGPVNINYTSTNLLTGLSAGKYVVDVKDISSNCVYTLDTIIVTGTYMAPNFNMAPTGVTCINGNDGKISLTSQNFGRGPFTYKIIAPSASSVGTTNTTGNFTGLVEGDYLVQLGDSCGGLQTRGITIEGYSWWLNGYDVGQLNCDSGHVFIEVKDSKGAISPNPVFAGFQYGASVFPGDTVWSSSTSFDYYRGKKHFVYLFAKDKCGNIKSALWIDGDLPGVDANVPITNIACSTFTATVTGQRNFMTPDFCIYDKNNVLLDCNITGVFNNLPYGPYCITIKDDCSDTTVTRCINVARPKPSGGAGISIVKGCNSIILSVNGSNLTNPNYCLYDGTGSSLISCNSSGIFPGVPYGSYCIKIINDPACYDTTIVLCTTVPRPLPTINPVVTISNLTCITFTASLAGVSNFTNGLYNLYNASNVLIASSSTPVFNNLLYGSYCIDGINDKSCYDTVISRCFTVVKPLPSLGTSINISNKTCAGYSAAVTGQQNITNPLYCLYDDANALLACNATGAFDGLLYSKNYCITTQNDVACYDTLLRTCFIIYPDNTSIVVSANKSCTTLGTTNLNIAFVKGTPSYTIDLFLPDGILLNHVASGSSNYTFNDLPNLPASKQYKIVVTDQCGNKDSANIIPIVSVVNRVLSTSGRCPSAKWTSGSSDVFVDINDNNIGGSIYPVLVKKNGIPAIVYSTTGVGYDFKFADLEPAVYIFQTYIQNCNKYVYDTLTVKKYKYPDLSGTKAYQCDNNGFTVSVDATGGIAPYVYEIFGSSPSFPSIIALPQPTSLFSINTGIDYSLIRLRAIDGCGNAGLYDASVLPLANFIVFADAKDCYNSNMTLRVDSIPNATYTWYKRVPNGDSVLVGTGPSYNMPSLSISDTGRYVSKILVNNGCLIKQAGYIITGSCASALPVNITLSGSKYQNANNVFWKSTTAEVKQFVLQRSFTGKNDFQDINTTANRGVQEYSFIDKNPAGENNFYRVKVVTVDNTVKYSNIIWLKNTKFDISFYPNPVNTTLYISISNATPKDYGIEITNSLGQHIFSKTYYKIQDAVINFPRAAGMAPGIYSVLVTDLQTNEQQTYKLIYK